jgi:hypothetical protein
MPRRVRVSILAAATALAVLLSQAGAGSAFAGQPIHPSQHFDGVVNERRSAVTIKVVCGGPVSPGETGRVASGQLVAVAKVANGRGFTGFFSQVYFWVNPPPGGPRPMSLTFSGYSEPQTIPTTFQVPCGGQGTVEFSSCPYLAPCAFGWVPETIKVMFDNIAV